MTAPFAAAQARANSAVMRHLANAEGTLNGIAVTGIFNALPVTSFDLVDGSAPTFLLPTANVDSDPRGQALVITGGSTYTVRNYRHDGAGLTTLILEAT